jgi:enoyl-[acyl-carrier protein] reductase II
MYLREHIFANASRQLINLSALMCPLLYPDSARDNVNIIVEEGVKIVFVSAGNPKTWTSFLKEHGITVVHVVGSVKVCPKSAGCGCRCNSS